MLPAGEAMGLIHCYLPCHHLSHQGAGKDVGLLHTGKRGRFDHRSGSHDNRVGLFRPDGSDVGTLAKAEVDGQPLYLGKQPVEKAFVI